MSSKQKVIYYLRYKRGGGRAARKLEKKGRRFLFLPYNKRKLYSNKFPEKKNFWDYKKNIKLTKKQKRKRAASRKFFFNLRKQKKVKLNQVSKNTFNEKKPKSKNQAKIKKKKHNHQKKYKNIKG
jgi:hypothetical protein